MHYFADNGKFWISYNHRNDSLATKLPEAITSYKNNPSGGIVSMVNNEYPFQAFIDLIRLRDKNNMMDAHLYMLVNPKCFANGVLKIYANNFETRNTAKSKRATKCCS